MFSSRFSTDREAFFSLSLSFSPKDFTVVKVHHYHIISGSHLAYGHAGSRADTDRSAKSIYNRWQLNRLRRWAALLYVLVARVHYAATGRLFRGDSVEGELECKNKRT